MEEIGPEQERSPVLICGLCSVRVEKLSGMLSQVRL